MAFSGYLLRVGGDDFPLAYVTANTYRVIPNRRQDVDSDRNGIGVLERNVLAHTPSTITFQTIAMDNIMLSQLMGFLREHYIIEKERKLELTYYCPDLDDYKTGNFYVPDIEFPIDYIDLDDNKIYYEEITLEFIEY